MNREMRECVLNPNSWIQFLSPKPEPGQIQPNGIDLRVNKLYVFNSETAGTPFFNDKNKVGYETEIYPAKFDSSIDQYYWFIEADKPYIVEYLESVKIPDYAMGLVFPRSSLWRLYSARIYTSVWDSGYHGLGKSLLVSKLPFKLQKGTTIAQLVLFSANASKKYMGSYQNEGLKDL